MITYYDNCKFRAFDFCKNHHRIRKIEKQLDEYLIYGGFPELVGFNQKIEIIELTNSYFGDIVEILGEDLSLVELFGKYVINSIDFEK